MCHKSCFFIGHRDAPEGLLPALVDTVERHITEYGVEDFVVGQYGRFDSLAARAVKDAKQRHPEVTLTLLLPYHPFDRPVQTLPGFDGTFYPPGMEKVPKRVAIVRANHYMVDHSDYLIAYAWQPASNARTLVEYAQKKEQQGRIHVTMLERMP
jgi:uncharacterized phage-like protein YoqJ